MLNRLRGIKCLCPVWTLMYCQDTSTSERVSCILASLSVVGLKASVSTRDNGAMEAELFMDNFTLDDDRPGTTGIRQ